MNRGDVYWADIVPCSGRSRPDAALVIVVSNDGFNHTAKWMSIIVVPLSTSAQAARRGPTVVAVPEGTAGLSKASVAVCHQVTTLDRSKLARRIGALPGSLMREVELGLMAAMDLE